MDAEDAFKTTINQLTINNCLTLDGTTGKTDNNSSTPCDNAEKKTPSTKITEILTEEELKKVTDNDEERSTAVNSETTLRSIATR